MCWSATASTVFAVTGFGAAAWMALKKDPEPAALWVCLAWFGLMEAIQAASYPFIEQCESPANQLLTLAGYLHISFQPFFINAVALYFMPKEAARKVAPLAYFVCFVGAALMLIQLYPFAWAGHCAPARPLCGGGVLCTVSGQWHIAWLLPINGIGNELADKSFLGYGFISYAVAAFYLPGLMGSWRFTLFSYLAGPVLAGMTTSNVNEWPAVWCLFSIGLLLVAMVTPLRRLLYVSDPWWMRLQRP